LRGVKAKQKMWHTVRGYLAAVVALVTCPCHLPVTLPILISLTAGTALGAWLQDNAPIVGGISTALFIGGLALALKWISQPACPFATSRSRRQAAPSEPGRI